MKVLKMRRRENDRIELTGFPKYLHKFVMFITFPFRKPAIVIPLLILAYLIPTFIGAKPAEVHLWYYHKITGLFSSVKDKVQDTGKNIIPDAVKDLGKQTIDTFRGREDNADKVVNLPENNPQAIRRQMFEKAKNNEPAALDIMQQPDNIRIAQVVSQEDVSAAADPKPVTQPVLTEDTKEKAQKKLDLIYLVTPQEFNGEARVRNANEIIIDGNTIFLFGIYVDPTSAKGIEAKTYLQKLIDGSTVKCIAEAYTKQGYATALCFANGKNLNHEMVDSGYSKNVALER